MSAVHDFHINVILCKMKGCQKPISSTLGWSSSFGLLQWNCCRPREFGLLQRKKSFKQSPYSICDHANTGRPAYARSLVKVYAGCNNTCFFEYSMSEDLDYSSKSTDLDKTAMVLNNFPFCSVVWPTSANIQTEMPLFMGYIDMDTLAALMFLFL